MPRPAFPKDLRQFQRQFATEEACQQYLAACRWPDGFVCPQGRQLRRAAGGPRDRESSALVDRHLSRRQPCAASGVLGTGRSPTPYRRIQGGRDMLKLLEGG